MKKYKVIIHYHPDHKSRQYTDDYAIEAENMEDAKSIVDKKMRYDYGFDDTIKESQYDENGCLPEINEELKEIEIIEIADYRMINLSAFYEKLNEEIEEVCDQKEEEEQRKKYEELKTRFENK